MRHKYNLNLFTADSPEIYYILGAWITDGNVSLWKKNYLARISSNDLEWIEKIQKLICPTLPISMDISRSGNPHYKLTITNKYIVQWFIDHECVPNKSLIVKMPNIPTQYVGDFIRGCLDGDGWISLQHQNHSKNKRMICGLATSSTQFMKAFQELLASFNISTGTCYTAGGIKLIMGRMCECHESYKVMTSGESSKKLCELCYYDGHTISMERKSILAKELLTYYSNNLHIWDMESKCKIDWPIKPILIEMVSELGYSAVGRILGVAGISVKRRIEHPKKT